MSEEGVERRLTTILAADVVGYSRLMAADEAGTLAQLKTHRKELIEPKTAEHHGRVVKLMGDGTLMEFGSVVDAVNFAVDLQRAMAGRNVDVPEDRQVTYRIGINVGDIIIEGEDIYGDGVNVAARLEGLAEPGGICLSQQAYDQVETELSLPFEDLGSQRVKRRSSGSASSPGVVRSGFRFPKSAPCAGSRRHRPGPARKSRTSCDNTSI